MTLMLNGKLKQAVEFARRAPESRRTARLAMDCLDLTSLRGDETKGDILDLCDMAQHNRLASVCLYPDKVAIAKSVLKESPVVIATVINFPYGDRRTLSEERATPETIKCDVSAAIKDGARQIDIVLPYESFLAGDTLSSLQFLRSCKKAWSPGVTLKVIFETAAFESHPDDRTDDLRRACRLAISEGVNCLKTSTGKNPAGGATLDAAAILLDEARHATSHRVGVKIAGGVKNNKDCAQYIMLAEAFRREGKPLGPEIFRIGGSSVLDNLLAALGSRKSLPSYEHNRN
jgi:deoxyribose-phosphate aldolase